jgi:hypothetical protein
MSRNLDTGIRFSLLPNLGLRNSIFKSKMMSAVYSALAGIEVSETVKGASLWIFRRRLECNERHLDETECGQVADSCKHRNGHSGSKTEGILGY